MSVLLVAIAVLPGARAAAQTVERPTLEILSVHHDPAGSLAIGLRADGGRDTAIQSLTMFINDVPVLLDLGERAVAEDLALLLVIDTSGSMAGVPIRAAREAARELVTRLPEGDRVGIVSFASSPIVRSGLTEDYGAVLTVIDGLAAQGATALYDAVAVSAEQLEGVPETRRVIVLLSDGQDFGSVSAVGRDGSIERAAASGVTVYAIGLGGAYDEAYLTGLAEATDGQFFAIDDENDVASLHALFARLGGELGSNETYTIPMRPLARGEHQLRVRGVVNGVPVSASAAFAVTNEGLITPSVAAPATAGDPLRVHFDPLVAPADLTVEARVSGVTFRPDSPSARSIAIDPWRLPPGTHEVDLIAFVGREVAARQVVEIEVPELAPSLTVSTRDGAVVARARMQEQTQAVLVAHSGGQEIARSTSGELSVAPTAEPIVVELLGASGAVLATHEIAAVASATPGDGVPWLPFGGLVLVAGGTVWWLRRRRGRRAPEPPPVLARLTSRPPALAPVDAAPRPIDLAAVRVRPLGAVLVRDAAGGLRQQITLTRRPLTIGRAASCDIVLDDPTVRPQHARLSALSQEEVQIHGLGDRGSRPFDGHEEDEWLVMQSGEQIALGSYYLQVVMGADALEGELAKEDGDEYREQAEAGA